MKWDDRIGRRLKLRDVHVLLAVVEMGSMGKAAERLSVSQPSVSKSISDLEHAMGVRLLERTARGVECTPYGQALLRRGLGAFDELRLSVKDIESLMDSNSGEVRVGAADPVSSGILFEIIDRFNRRYPRVAVTVVTMSGPPHDIQGLRDRRVDFYLGALDSSFTTDEMDAEILFKERIFIVSGSQSKWARRRKIAISELVDETWLLPRGGPFRSNILESFQAVGLTLPTGGVQTRSVHQRMKLLATNRFLGAEAGQLLHFNARQYSLIKLPVELPIRPWPFAIVTMKNRAVSPVVQNFLGHVREVAKDMIGARE